MIDNKNVLYIHGMGGGGDSRIPSILRDNMPEGVNVIVRTYSFDPETAWTQISSWLDELHPSVIVGESLGSLNAIRIKGLPHILVSPSLNAPLYLGHFAFLASLPGVTWLLDRIYKPREGDRQKLHFTTGTMRKYLAIVSIRTWRKYFGRDDTYMVYDGTHFMEEEFVISLLKPKILMALGLK